MRHYIKWIIIFALLLISVPVLIIAEYVLLAKLIGIILVLLVTIAIRLWVGRANKMTKATTIIKLNADNRFIIDKYYPSYKSMSNKARLEFESEIIHLLQHVLFDDAQNEKINSDDCLIFCLLLKYNNLSPVAFKFPLQVVFDGSKSIETEKTAEKLKLIVSTQVLIEAITQQLNSENPNETALKLNETLRILAEN
jgi:hypothetical protein|uniref:hypothetical protein n=1 Tax=Fluviicola sp. TaxID=1917219 RepID=UPI00404AC1D1